MTQVEIIRSGELDAEREAKLARRSEELQRRLADALRKTRIDWSPTEGDEDIGVERKKHLAHAHDGLRRVLARAADAEARSRTAPKGGFVGDDDDDDA